MQFQIFVAFRRQSTHIPHWGLWLTGLAGLAILVIPIPGPRIVSAREPIIQANGPERPSDPARTRATTRADGLTLGTPRPARMLDPGTPIQVFQTHCVKCHDNDGRGEVVREILPKIPDFTDPQWQDSRSGDEVMNSILKGKGKSMRPMKDKLGAVEVRRMVSFIRAFRGGGQIVPDEPEGSSDASTAEAPFLPPTALSVETGRRLFARFCVKCHEADGTGRETRASLPTIPNFTDPKWQAKPGDRQWVVTILDGKGRWMPAFRGRLSDAEARELVAYVRTLGPTRARSVESSPTEFEDRFRQLEQQYRQLEARRRELSTH